MHNITPDMERTESFKTTKTLTKITDDMSKMQHLKKLSAIPNCDKITGHIDIKPTYLRRAKIILSSEYKNPTFMAELSVKSIEMHFENTLKVIRFLHLGFILVNSVTLPALVEDHGHISYYAAAPMATVITEESARSHSNKYTCMARLENIKSDVSKQIFKTKCISTSNINMLRKNTLKTGLDNHQGFDHRPYYVRNLLYLTQCQNISHLTSK